LFAQGNTRRSDRVDGSVTDRTQTWLTRVTRILWIWRHGDRARLPLRFLRPARDTMSYRHTPLPHMPRCLSTAPWCPLAGWCGWYKWFDEQGIETWKADRIERSVSTEIATPRVLTGVAGALQKAKACRICANLTISWLAIGWLARSSETTDVIRSRISI
jgi:hypothetical protein